MRHSPAIFSVYRPSDHATASSNVASGPRDPGVVSLHVNVGHFSTTARRVTSPTWGPPPPSKQALISSLLRESSLKHTLHQNLRNLLIWYKFPSLDGQTVLKLKDPKLTFQELYVIRFYACFYQGPVLLTQPTKKLNLVHHQICLFVELIPHQKLSGD